MRKTTRNCASFPRTLSAVILACCLLLLQGCDICEWVPDDLSKIGISRQWIIIECPFDFTDEQLVGAIIVPSGAQLVGLDVIINGLNIPIDTHVSVADRNALTNEFVSRGLFKPNSQSAFFFRTTTPISIPPNATGEWKIHFGSGAPFSIGSIIAAGTTASDLSDGFPLSNFKFFVDQISAEPVPTVSEWGLVVIGLLLLIGATIVLGFRRPALAGMSGAPFALVPTLPLFAAPLFARCLGAAVILLAVILALVVWHVGSVNATDLIGSSITTVGVAYLVHLWLLLRRGGPQG